MKLSVCVTLGEEVAEAAAEPVTDTTSLKACVIPSAASLGERAEKYWPRPFTAACHKSSTAVGLSATGVGQLHVLVKLDSHVQPVEPVVILK